LASLSIKENQEMRFNKNLKRKVGFEHLETRAMMAGNVTAEVLEGGQLFIKGTTKDNFVVVTKFNNGDVKVAGVPGTNTKINGHSSETFEGVDSLFATMGSGNDGFAILKGTFFGLVEINTGNGIDGVALTKLTAGGVQVNTGADTDVVVAAFVTINSESTTTFASVSAQQAEFGTFGVNTSGGDDYVLLARVSAEGINVQTGAGSDKVGLIGCGAFGISVGLGSGVFDVLGVGFSEAQFANFDGGGNPADTYVHARNNFGSETATGFQLTYSLDSLVDQLENSIQTLQPIIQQLPGIKNLPNLSSFFATL
jgi:hypothetical protein